MVYLVKQEIVIYEYFKIQLSGDSPIGFLAMDYPSTHILWLE